MPWILRDQEVSAMLQATDDKRYTYFIKRVADVEKIWGLKDDRGWVVMGDDEGQEVLPVWPHERYASACATGDWTNSQPEVISLNKWMSAWLPGLEREGRLIGVFPNLSGRAVVVSSAKLRLDIEAELERY